MFVAVLCVHVHGHGVCVKNSLIASEASCHCGATCGEVTIPDRSGDSGAEFSYQYCIFAEQRQRSFDSQV